MISHVAPLAAKLASNVAVGVGLALVDLKFAELFNPIACERSVSRLGRHDQYTTIVRSKPSQMILNILKGGGHKANRLNDIR
jgi:hypothetical protein